MTGPATEAQDHGEFCGRCGEATGDDRSAHEACRSALELEPPRYCPRCRRRMVVQVVPRGYTATCSVHGAVSAARP